MKTVTIVVLNDGEQWSLANDCALMVLTEADYRKLESGEVERPDDPDFLNPLMVLKLDGGSIGDEE